MYGVLLGFKLLSLRTVTWPEFMDAYDKARLLPKGPAAHSPSDHQHHHHQAAL